MSEMSYVPVSLEMSHLSYSIVTYQIMQSCRFIYYHPGPPSTPLQPL